jgi:hypothetical protein
MQRVQVVAPQTAALAQAAFGRVSTSTFTPHSSVSAERMKSEKHLPVTAANLAQALWKHKNSSNEGLHNERKEKRPRTEKLRIEDIKTAMHKADDLTVACPIFQLFGSAARCSDSGRCKPHKCTVCDSITPGALEEEACEAKLRARLVPHESKQSKPLINEEEDRGSGH